MTDERDVLEALVTQAGQLRGQGATPRLLRTAAALIEQAGYEVARTEEPGRVTQLILLAAEIERLGATLERDMGGAASEAPGG